jgi:hypothetical protein
MHLSRTIKSKKMHRNFIVLILTCTFFIFAQAQRSPLFKIIEKNRIGFINQKGEVVIKPIFRSVGAFVKDLAPARVDGLYGYIDTLGNFVIPEGFDYAAPFSEDLAVVVQGERQSVIQRDGKHCFSSFFAQMGSFKLGRAVVISKSGKKGLIDTHGKLVIDTSFESIFPSEFGQYVVELSVKDPEHYQYGIFNRLGKAIVPLDTFYYIRPFSEGFAVARWRPGKNNLAKNLVFDTSGHIVFEHLVNDDCGIISGPFHEGRACLRFWPGMFSGNYNSSKEYQGYIDTKGKVILRDTSIHHANDFQNGLAFVRLKSGDYRLIDTNMRQVGAFLFKIQGEFGSNARFAVAKPEGQEKYAVITRDGNIKIKSPINQSEEEYFAGQHIIFAVEQKRKPGEEWASNLYGVYDTTGKIIIEAKCAQISDLGFQHGVLTTIVEGRLTYFNEKGEIIWQQSEEKIPENINIDYMDRGYFHASSKVDKFDIGGFGKSDNQAKKLNPRMGFPQKPLSVWIDTSNLVQTPDMHNVYNMYVVNRSGKEAKFPAQDSRLDLKIQALDASGQWRDIIFLPRSDCGNSFHTLTLDNKEYWNFKVFRYEGVFKTKIRAALTYYELKSVQGSKTVKLDALLPGYKMKVRKREPKTLEIYSNTVEMSINPAQFWRVESYYPQGIMDPYPFIESIW